MKRVLGLIFICCSLAAGLARADTILAQLVNPSLTGSPGDTLQFFATLMNPSDTDTIYLNGIGSTASSPFLNVDTSPFDINAPLFLAPGDVSGPFEFFDVAIDPSAPDGPYVGSFVSILGGADGGAGTSFDNLADVSFDVIVASPTTGVPEPGTLMTTLLTTVVISMVVALARRRCR